MDSHNSASQFPSIRYLSPSKGTIGEFPQKNRKKLIRKRYGRKIIFVGKWTRFTAAMNRSKYFLSFTIDSFIIDCDDFKSLQNRIVLHKEIFLQTRIRRTQFGYSTYFGPNIHRLQAKKALRSCKNPKAKSPKPQLLQHIFNLKSLDLDVPNAAFMSKTSKAVRNLRFLQSLSIQNISDLDATDPYFPIKLEKEEIIPGTDEKANWGLSNKISKIPTLQRFSLKTSLATLERQCPAVQQDFVDFYSASHNFKIDTEIYVNSSLDIKELTSKNVASILKNADCLSIQMGISKISKKNPYGCCRDIQGIQSSEQENKRLLKQSERSVKFSILYKEKLQINIGCLLSLCENLISLYLKISGMEVFWDQSYERFPKKLQSVILDVDFLGLTYEILDDNGPSRFQTEQEIHEVSHQRKVKFHSGLVQLLKQLKARAEGLETFTLFICFRNFKRSYYQPKDFMELFEKMTEEKAKEFFEELESFEKLHKIDLCKEAGREIDADLNRILQAKSLKTVHIRSCETNV